MTNKITENTIENFCIELLEKQGYEYLYAPILRLFWKPKNEARLA